MRSGTLLSKVRYDRKHAKAGGLKHGLLLVGLLFALPFCSSAQHPPSFQNGSAYSITQPACGNLQFDISSWLKVNDLDAGEVETWFEQTSPNLGGLLSLSETLPGSGAVRATVNGLGVAIPPAIYYTPTAALSAIGGHEDFTIGVDDGTGRISYITVTVNVIPGPTLTLGDMPSVCAGSSTAIIPVAGMSNIGSASMTFTYTGFPQTWVVPSFITAVDYDLNGASGGSDNSSVSPVPGKGGNIHGHLSVTPGSTLNIYVGGQGGSSTGTGAAGGFNGGGSTSFYVFGSGGGGGGATDIRIGDTTLSDRVVVAGGGGGTGYDGGLSLAGGDGGGLIGAVGSNNLGGYHANGGTQISPGNGSIFPGRVPGGNGSFGIGGDGSTQGLSGGGGGGYYGGGGGIWNGGAGGSSFANPILSPLAVTTPGVNTGNGVATISYSIPGTVNITWDATAQAAGFANVAGASFTASGISVEIPATISVTAATTYNGILTVNNGTCQSENYPIYVTVKPVPSVHLPSNQAVCNGDATAAVVFVNDPITATSLKNKWVNSNPLIGLGVSDSTNIPSITPSNLTALPIVANITVTPVADGCEGTPQTFQMVSNPIPHLSSPTTAPSICDNAVFVYEPTSATPGTTFAWSRASVANIDNPGFSGSGTITEALDNTGANPVAVTYIETLSANGCNSTESVVVTVNPTATLNSITTPAAICDSTMFSYVPESATTAATFNWSRGTITGIGSGPASGADSIKEVLHNTTSAPVTVTYVYSVGIGGCTTTTNVTTVVNPTPRLTSASTMSPSCDNVEFTYEQSSSVTGTTYRWGRPAVTGITGSGSGTGNITETLHNTTPFAINVIYHDTLSAYGCISTYDMSKTIKPTPKLSTSLNAGSKCSGDVFMYSPSTLTPLTTIEWARDQVYGISNDSNRAFNNISEPLFDTIAVPVTVPYHYVLTSGGCVNTQDVTVVVNPLPKLSNPTTSISVCDNQVVNFVPSSATSGTTYGWTRAYVPGISQTASFGVNNPNEPLHNTTNVNVDATYVYTLAANGCSHTENVTVTVHPTPTLSSLTSRSACANSPFTYSPLSFTPGTTYEWSRSPVSGITPAAKMGSGNIVDTLYSSSTSPIAVVYVYTLYIGGCPNQENVTVTVAPGPVPPAITTTSPSNVCSNTMFANFAAASAPPSGITYSWSASNATVFATGGTTQYALVNFNTPGTATVMLTAHQAGTGCTSASSTYTVTVGDGGAPTANVIYYAGQFIAQQSGADSYQWGYDDVNTLESHTVAGETNQNYYEPVPDGNKLYWVMTTKNGCSQKSYYKAPTGVEELATVSGIKVYPNPAENFINVEVSAAVSGNVQVEMFNMLGQKVNTVSADNHKARLDVSTLPAGCYIIECVSDGVKAASARFIKN